MAESALSGIYNYRAVDESLCTSGQPTAAQLAAIAAAGFATIINLALHDDPRYSLPDEPGVVKSLGLAYVHIPVQFAAPTEADLLAFFAAMDAQSGKRLWVHCAANMRVSAFLGLYRVIKLGWEVEPAFELMRGLWQPNEVWSSFIAAALEKHGTAVRPSMALSIEMAQVALRSQPFSVLLGAELTSFDSECVELRVPITEHVKQQHGFVHGGVISYAADNALTFAGGAALGPAVVTSEFKINYLRPAKGEVLVARASVVHAGKSQAVCQCQVFAIAGGEEALCAVAQGTIAALSQPK